jgi:LysM repeat protein
MGANSCLQKEESRMKNKKLLQVFVVLTILLASFTTTGSAHAWYGCGGYVTVQWGDTLSGLAAYCGTTVSAIRAANPGLGWWVYAGQVIYIPSGYSYSPQYPPVTPTSAYYTVRRGDTLGNIAKAYSLSLGSVIAANPQIWNPSLIYPGQVITIPSSYSPPYTPPNVPPPPPPPVSAPAGYEGVLTVIAGKGVNIRNQPSYTGKIVLADDYTKGKTYYYRINSVTYDASYQRTWVEVVISQTSTGYTTGWLPVSGPQNYLNHSGPIEDWVTPHIQ